MSRKSSRWPPQMQAFSQQPTTSRQFPRRVTWHGQPIASQCVFKCRKAAAAGGRADPRQSDINGGHGALDCQQTHAKTQDLTAITPGPCLGTPGARRANRFFRPHQGSPIVAGYDSDARKAGLLGSPPFSFLPTAPPSMRIFHTFLAWTAQADQGPIAQLVRARDS